MEKLYRNSATLVGGRVVGDESIVITETRGFEQAVKQSITLLLVNMLNISHYAKRVLLSLNLKLKMHRWQQIVVDNAKAAFAQVLELFHPPVVVPREVHSTAIIGDNVTLW